MKNPARVVLGFTLAMCATWGAAVASEGGAASSKQPDPLTQAAEEFKVLTATVARPEVAVARTSL